jgi:hypothetical protein
MRFFLSFVVFCALAGCQQPVHEDGGAPFEADAAWRSSLYESHLARRVGH